MKIQSSNIQMHSNRTYSSYVEKKQASMITTDEQAATIEFSEESKSLVEQMEEKKKELKKQAKEQQQQNLADLIEEQARAQRTKEPVVTEPEEDYKIKVLKKILEMLRRMQKGERYCKEESLKEVKAEFKSLQATQARGEITLKGAGVPIQSGNVKASTGWTKTTVTSAFVSEAEHTAYTASGVARTADGRELSFGVTVEMSRAFCAKYESFIQEDYVCTDPLVINLDSNVPSVTDQKFLFDLDSDGKEEKISFAGKGSGFLALDKNQDGKINDGSELFGTKSGNGFADLAQYDKDKNGWIDENDEVFEKLRIWTKDEEGKDHLITLKEADVGAIYLSYNGTEFSLKNEEHQTNAIVRNTGIYLKESGGVSTIQHIDLTT